MPLFKLLMNYTKKTIMNLTEFSPGLAFFILTFDILFLYSSF